MAAKKYAPVRISNPGEGHLVPLLPTQGFIIGLSGDNPEIEYSSSFFELDSKEIVGNATFYHFSQKYDLGLWSRISRVFLGEIMVLSGTSMGSLCVVLDSLNRSKSSLLTVINPQVNNIKVDASHLLEIVIYDEEYSDAWDCQVMSGYSGLKYEQVQYKKVDSQQFSFSWNEVDKLYFSYPRSCLCGPSPIPVEHHYFFRFDYPSITTIANMSSGTYTGGKIVFEASDNFKILNINLNIRDKTKSKLFGASRIINTRKVSDMNLFIPTEMKNNKKRVPKNPSLMKNNIFLRPKTDTELDGDRVIYF